MFKRQANIVVDTDKSDRLDEIIKSIDGLIFSIKMDSFQSISAHRTGNGKKALEYTTHEMMAKKNILFNLIPRDELYAITKKKSPAKTDSAIPLN